MKARSCPVVLSVILGLLAVSSARADDAAILSHAFIDPADPAVREVRRLGEWTLDRAGVMMQSEVRRVLANTAPAMAIGVMHLKDYKLPAFAPGPVNALEPRIRELCVKLLDQMEGQEIVNGGMDYAQYIPAAVISRMLGFPEKDDDIFREFVHIVLEGVDHPVEQRIEEFAPIEQYFTTQIEDHQTSPRDDLTSYLLNVEVGGEKLAIEHVFGTMLLVLVAGIDTTWSAIGASLLHLATHSDDLERLVNEPELMPFAIEEFLRFYAPVTMARLVKHDMDYLGVPMKEYDWILLGFPAANRDPAVFKDADKFIIDRLENRHLAFGLGIHRCAGSNLARLELRVAIEEFIKRYPRFEVADSRAVTFAQGQVRGPRNLPFRVLT